MAYGNLDKDKQYPITQDAIDKGLYVIRSFKNFSEQLPNGKVEDRGVEDPATSRIGVFTQNTYDEYVRENEQEGKVNTFNKMLGKYVILHDPTIESDEDLTLNTKVQLLDILNHTEGVSDEDLKLAATPSTNKAGIIELITKYKQA